MARYVAFLRAVNVGRRRMAMADLREAVEALGYDDVGTHIASGNVLLATTAKAKAVESAMEAALDKRFGFDVPTFVRTPAQIRKAVDLEPFAGEPGGDDTWSITFLRSAPPAAAKKAVAALSNDVDLLAVHGAELHWAVRGGGRSATTVKDAQVERALGGMQGTNRSTTMLRKLLDRL